MLPLTWTWFAQNVAALAGWYMAEADVDVFSQAKYLSDKL